MDEWEQRFDAVVRETERNLAKVKGTLQKAPTKYKLSSQTATTPQRNILLDLTPSHKERNVVTSSYTSHVTPTRDHHVTFQENSKPRRASPDAGYHKEFWRQEDEIHKLRKQISLLQQSNVHYEQETKLLKTQVHSLKTKSKAISPVSGATKDLTREFEKFKSEVLTQIQRLKQDVDLGDSGSGVFSEKEFANIRKDIDSTRLRHAEDFQELKNDLDSLRSRLVKVELEVKSAMSDSKECIRRCQRLGSEASHFTDTIRIQSKSTSSQLQSLNDNCAHLSILRGTVSDIEGRLSSLEGTASRISNYRNESVTPASLRDSRGSSYIGELGKHSKPTKLRNGILDELDISLDDLSILSDDIIDEEDDDDLLDKSLDGSLQLSETETFKDSPNKINLSLTESVSMGGETLSVAGDLVSGISGILSDDDDI